MMEPIENGRHDSGAAPEDTTDDVLKALISAAANLCLLRLGPQHMPASPALFALLLLLSLVVGSLLAMAMGIEFSVALLESLFELLLMLSMLYLALKWVRKLSRFSQTGIALMLSGLLLNLLALPLVSWNQHTASTESGLLVLVLFFWSILVLGHIIRHTFDVDLNIGIAVGLLYTLMIINLAALLFPVPA